MRRTARLIAPLLCLVAPAAGLAQAYQCRIPPKVSVPQVRPDGPSRPLAVTGYTLALSWSPEYCKGREAAAAQRFQCSGSSGTFGFVVHGLWPESRGNSWPQWCATRREPTPATIRRNLCTVPSAALIARQWAKHGACMTRRPETYFNITRILYDSLAWPDFDALSHKPDLTAGDVRSLFAAANKGWSEAAVGVKLNERGWLQELRLCYDRRFRPKACDRRRFGAGNEQAAKIWRGL
ncbi:ribonuclease T [Altererythrobacter aurantiacus]|uniref:Ribonuclease T n=1 Tax=Parapontixanthobacter aurantiacus TaxID=1463599 RepID=A0A844ZIU7_9SPHN|nr:ribonuclease T [Parapontixanthobacter aurantiacus]MXO86910.1 ribonuclease T [Parapontixanthobacter aurantiacus]